MPRPALNEHDFVLLQGILPADCFPALPARSLRRGAAHFGGRNRTEGMDHRSTGFFRHAIAYSNIDGQEQVHETKALAPKWEILVVGILQVAWAQVTCSGEDCETMSNDASDLSRDPAACEAKRGCAAARGHAADHPRENTDQGREAFGCKVLSKAQGLLGPFRAF